MFDTLIESKRKKQKNAGQAAFSLILHVVLIYGAVKATQAAGETLNKVLTDTTMVFIEPPKATPPPPPPEQVVVAANPPPQGFQTVMPPAEIPTEIPPVNLNEHFDPRDFTGKGVEGGIATGVVGGTGPVVSGEVFLSEELEDRPEPISLKNPPYPPALEAAGIPGQVVAQFVVDTTGHVEVSSFKIMKSSHKAFEDPVRESVLKAIFKPGRMHGKAVRTLVQLPLSFKPGN